MRLTIYITAILFSLFLIGLGIIGSLGTSVSYKYEVDDETVQITIDRLDESGQKNEIKNLEKRKQQLDINSILYGILTVLGISSVAILLIKRKSILNHE